MFRTMLKSKIHRATVVQADVDYVGSITIDSDLMKAADLYPYEKVHVVDIDNGARLETYAIEGQAGVLAGTEVFEAVFGEIDARVRVTWHARDGERLHDGTAVAHVEGPLRAILAAERTALNFLQRLSGVATMAHRFADEAGAPDV